MIMNSINITLTSLYSAYSEIMKLFYSFSKNNKIFTKYDGKEIFDRNWFENNLGKIQYNSCKNNADKFIAQKQVFEIEAIQESVKSFRNAVFLRLRDDKRWDECNPVNIRIKENLI